MVTLEMSKQNKNWNVAAVSRPCQNENTQMLIPYVIGGEQTQTMDHLLKCPMLLRNVRLNILWNTMKLSTFYG